MLIRILAIGFSLLTFIHVAGLDSSSTTKGQQNKTLIPGFGVNR